MKGMIRSFFIVLLTFLTALALAQGSDKGSGISILYVDASSTVKAPDGSPERPYQSLSAAVSALKAKGKTAKPTIFRLAPGEYRDAVLDLASAFQLISWDGKKNEPSPSLASKVILNRVRIELKHPVGAMIRNLSLKDSIILMTNRNATLFVENAVIEGGRGAGLKVSGGSLSMNRCLILNSKASSGSRALDEGTGIVLQGGALAHLLDISCKDNDDGALRMSGMGTRAWVSGLKAEGNKSSGASAGDVFERGIGAVEARDGASLMLENSQIAGNAILGIMIADGARAHIRSSEVSSTSRLPGTNQARYGSNIVVISSQASQPSRLELANVKTSKAQGFGLQSVDGYLYAADSSISGNAIGLVLISPQNIVLPDLDACFSNTSCQGNELDISLNNLPLPDPSRVLGQNASATSPACGRLPWEDWPGL